MNTKTGGRGPSETRHNQKKKIYVNRAISELAKNGISDPTAEDVYAYIVKTRNKEVFPLKAIRKTMEDIQPVAGLDELMGMASDKKAINPEREAIINDQEENIVNLISKLNERDHYIIVTMLTWFENEGKRIPLKQLHQAYVRDFDPDATQEMVKRAQRVAVRNMDKLMGRTKKKYPVYDTPVETSVTVETNDDKIINKLLGKEDYE